MSRGAPLPWLWAALTVLAGGRWAVAGGLVPWHQRPGLWQMTTKIASVPMPPQVTKTCIGATTPSLFRRPGPVKTPGHCDPPAVKVAGSTTTMDTSCKIGASRLITHLVVDRLSDTRFHEDSETRFEPPRGNRGPMRTASDAVWLGACPASMKPGDTVIGSRTFHVPATPR